MLADYLPYAEVVTVPDPLPAVPDCRDPFDLPFLHLAVAGRATTLVTGDAELLAVGRVARCAIVTPDTFVSRLLVPEVPGGA